MKKRLGPYASPGERQRWAANAMPPLMYAPSGELTATVNKATMGAVINGGRVADVFLAVNFCGEVDEAADGVSLSGEVYINGVSCLSTKPTITVISGETNQHKTTAVTGDTGIVQAVVDQSANTVSPGDVLTCDLTVNRNNSPTAELHGVVLAVEFVPD